MTRCKPLQINDNMNTNWQAASCLDGRSVTRTEICPSPFSPPWESIFRGRHYPPPPPIKLEFPSTDTSRHRSKPTTPCRSGGSRPSDGCLPPSCGLAVPESREKQQLFLTSTRPYPDLSLEKDPRCTACQTRSGAPQYRPRDRSRYSGPCVALKTSQEPANTSIYQQSITSRDFTSPGTSPPWTRTKGNRRSFYDRFMADMCRLCVLVESIPDHGSLGGEVSQYQLDFAEKTPRKLGDLYSLPVHSRSPVPGTASAYSACHRICNF